MYIPLICSLTSSKTKFINWSYPLRTPVTCRPPTNLTLISSSLYLFRSSMSSRFGPSVLGLSLFWYLLLFCFWYCLLFSLCDCVSNGYSKMDWGLYIHFLACRWGLASLYSWSWFVFFFFFLLSYLDLGSGYKREMKLGRLTDILRGSQKIKLLSSICWLFIYKATACLYMYIWYSRACECFPSNTNSSSTFVFSFPYPTST